jgi:hypothetical protein
MSAISRHEENFNWFADSIRGGKYCKDLFLSPIEAGFGLAEIFNGSLSSTEAGLAKGIKGSKQALSLPCFIIDLNEAVKSAGKAVRTQNQEKKGRYALAASGSIASLVCPATDMYKFVDYYGKLGLPQHVTQAVGLAGSSALLVDHTIKLICSSFDLKDSVKKICGSLTSTELKEEKVRVNHHSILIAKSVAYIAYAIIGIIGLALLATPISPFIGIALFTSAIALTIIAFIYDKVAGYKASKT